VSPSSKSGAANPVDPDVRGSNGADGTALSVVIVADRFETIAQTVAHLAAQSIVESMELVIVTHERSELEVPEDLRAAFARIEIVESQRLLPLAVPLAAGIRRARAPIVALAESHAFPADDRWAQALVEAHGEPWAAVGPVIGNANPASMASWASLFLDYASCVELASSGDVALLPGHNTSYKRKLLADHDADLEAMFDAEVLLQAKLRARGHRLLLSPAIKVYHLNVTRPSSWLRERYCTGRRFAAARAHEWAAWRRFAYACGSPLIPLVRLPRALRDIARSRRRRTLLPRVVPWLVLGLLASSVGELIGYAAGAGRATLALAEMELHKADHLNAADRRALVDWTPARAERAAATGR